MTPLFAEDYDIIDPTTGEAVTIPVFVSCPFLFFFTRTRQGEITGFTEHNRVIVQVQNRELYFSEDGAHVEGYAIDHEHMKSVSWTYEGMYLRKHPSPVQKQNGQGHHARIIGTIKQGGFCPVEEDTPLPVYVKPVPPTPRYEPRGVVEVE